MNYNFLLLTAALIAFRAPFFFNKIFPFLDTDFAFQQFYIQYNEFFFHREFFRWMPFALYGLQSDAYLITTLSPSCYFAGLTGWIFGIEDALFLFNLALLLDHLILLLGTYLLSKRLYKHEATVFFVCLSVIGTVSFAHNIYYGIRIFYLLPLIIYFISRFFDEYRSKYLLTAMTVFVIQGIGIQPYMMVIPLLSVIVISSFLLFQKRKELRLLAKMPDKKSAALLFIALILLCVVTASYLQFVLNALDSIDVLTRGRNESGTVDLDVFLTYGYHTGYDKFIDILMPVYDLRKSGAMPLYDDSGVIKGNNISIFSGIMTLFFITYMLFKRRFAPFSLSIMALIALLAFFSVGEKGYVADALYGFFPGMKYYRHIGYVVDSFKLFLPLLCGFGLDRFLGEPDKPEKSFYRPMIAATAITALCGFYVAMYALRIKHSPWWVLLDAGPYRYAIGICIALAIIFIATIYMLRKLPSSGFLKAALISMLLFEVVNIQFLNNIPFYQLSMKIPFDEEAIRVKRYVFDDGMSALQDRAATEKRMLFQANLNPANDAAIMNYLFRSPCSYAVTLSNPKDYLWSLLLGYDFRFRVDIINQYVKRTIWASTGDGSGLYDGTCVDSKLALISDVLFIDGIDEAEREIKRGAWTATNKAIMVGVPDETRHLWDKAEGKTTIGSIRVKDFWSNGIGIDVEIPDGTASWLYYADAWHPKWKAFVNGKPVHIAQANIGFKAVMLNGGFNEVRFIYDDAPGRYRFYILALTAMAFVSCIIGKSFVLSIRRAS